MSSIFFGITSPRSGKAHDETELKRRTFQRSISDYPSSSPSQKSSRIHLSPQPDSPPPDSLSPSPSSTQQPSSSKKIQPSSSSPSPSSSTSSRSTSRSPDPPRPSAQHRVLDVEGSAVVLASLDQYASGFSTSFTVSDVTPELVEYALDLLFVSARAEELEELDLENNRLPALPQLLAQGPLAISSLSLENNHLRSLPPNIHQSLPKLDRVHLECNQLTSLPPALGQMQHLRRLFLDNNCLSSLPPEIGNLANLLWLSVDQNRLSALPPELERCAHLQYLSADGNNLTDLPSELFRIGALCTLSVLDNPGLTQLPLEISRRPDLVFRHNAVCTIPRKLLPDPSKTAGSDIQNTRLIFDYLKNIVQRNGFQFSAKAHWQPDSGCPSCIKCKSSFTVTKRRHHCRLCGRVFCHRCCSMTMNLPVMGSSRICADCFSGLAQDNAHLIDRQRLAERPDELSLLVESLTHIPALSPSEWSQMPPDAQINYLNRQLQAVHEAISRQENILASIESFAMGRETSRSDLKATMATEASSGSRSRSQHQYEEANVKLEALKAAKNRISLQLEQLEQQ